MTLYLYDKQTLERTLTLEAVSYTADEIITTGGDCVTASEHIEFSSVPDAYEGLRAKYRAENPPPLSTTQATERIRELENAIDALTEQIKGLFAQGTHTP